MPRIYVKIFAGVCVHHNCCGPAFRIRFGTALFFAAFYEAPAA